MSALAQWGCHASAIDTRGAKRPSFLMNQSDQRDVGGESEESRAGIGLQNCNHTDGISLQMSCEEHFLWEQAIATATREVRAWQANREDRGSRARHAPGVRRESAREDR